MVDSGTGFDRSDKAFLYVEIRGYAAENRFVLSTLNSQISQLRVES
jgi:hypothetical protein